MKAYRIAWLCGRPETALIYRGPLQNFWVNIRLSVRNRFMPDRICTAGPFTDDEQTPEQHAAIGDRILNDARMWRINLE